MPLCIFERLYLWPNMQARVCAEELICLSALLQMKMHALLCTHTERPHEGRKTKQPHKRTINQRGCLLHLAPWRVGKNLMMPEKQFWQ
jgi:hypothetical protein